MGAIADLVKAGYVRHIGLSEVGAETIRRARSGASHRRSADRVFADLARHRGRHPADLPRARHRHHRLWRAVARPDQRPLVEGARGRAGFPRRCSPRFQGENLDTQPGAGRALAQRLPSGRRDRRAGRDRLGGGAGRPTSCRWSARAGATGWPRRWARSTSICRRTPSRHRARRAARCRRRRALSGRAARPHGQRERPGAMRALRIAE